MRRVGTEFARCSEPSQPFRRSMKCSAVDFEIAVIPGDARFPMGL